MNTEIIPSQKKMLLEAALAFEEVVKSVGTGQRKNVTW
jgi:hypothetical protein